LDQKGPEKNPSERGEKKDHGGEKEGGRYPFWEKISSDGGGPGRIHVFKPCSKNDVGRRKNGGRGESEKKAVFLES